MSRTLILAAVAVGFMAVVFAAGLLVIRVTKGKLFETMKAALWFCLLNGCGWVWCSYLLAYLGREQIAENLSQVAVKEIIAAFVVYGGKALVENLSKNNIWPDKKEGKNDDGESC